MFNNAVIDRERIVTEDEYRLFSEYIEQRFGWRLKSGRMLTFHMRVSHRLAILGIETYREYYDHLLSDPRGMESALLLSHLTSHETCYCHDSDQLRLLSALLKEFGASHRSGQKKRLRILSAGSGAGEEAYTLSAVVHGCGFSPPAWHIEIIGIDVNPAAIARAQEGWYRRDALADAISDVIFLREYFDAMGDRYVVKPYLREHVEFRAVNLVESESFAGLGAMDIIFCRQVLSGMADSGIQRLARNLFNALSDDGYLFISASESLIQHTSLFVPVYFGALTVYRKNSRNRQEQAGLQAATAPKQRAK